MKTSTVTLSSLVLLLLVFIASLGVVSSVSQNTLIPSFGQIVYEQTHLYLHTIYEAGGTYYSADPTGDIEYQNSDARNVLDWAINNSPDYAKIVLREAVFNLSSWVGDHGKDGIIIEGESWDTIIVIAGTNDGFRIQDQKDWEFRNFKIQGTKRAKGQSGFESGHFILMNTRNVTIENVWSRTANGYSVRPCDTSAPTYNVNLKILNNLFDDPGHSAISAVGLNDSRIEGNTMVKYDYGIDMELIWIGAHNWGFPTPVGSYRNKILRNTLTGGSLAISLDAYNSGNLAYVADNLVSQNTIEGTQSTYPRIWVRGWYNNITENTINDGNTARTSYIIDLATLSGDTPNESRGNRIEYNTIYHVAAVAIGGWNTKVNGGSISYNRVRGTPSGMSSIEINHPSSDYITCIGNVVRRTIRISGNANGIETNNTENASD